MRELPPEIKLVIIDALQSGSHEFADPFSGIALVWPEVIYRIRKHRFSTIQLRTIRNLRFLIDILEPMPSICAVVRAVRVTSATDLYKGQDLPRLFKLLKGLTAVDFDCLRPLSQPRTVFTLNYLPSTITNVELHMYKETIGTRTNALMKVFEILSVFPRMECLRIKCEFGDGLAEDVIENLVAKPFTSLRTVTLSYCRLVTSVSMQKLIERGMFPILESLTIEEPLRSHSSLSTFNRLLRCWSSTLRELRMPFCDDAAQDTGTLSFFLPQSLEVLEFQITVRYSPHESAQFCPWLYLDIWARTLEQRCRCSEATLRSLEILVVFQWPVVQHFDSTETARIRRLDAALGSSGLHAMHLDWHLVCIDHSPRDFLLENAGEPGAGSAEASFRWVNENMFPATNARFLTEDGMAAFGTTSTSTTDVSLRSWY
ncbi:hypothetical protein CYLTODRAFT_421622 [Cylindrobasidium torrendii FP15055 ss-10]|uniref:F-box domain-containing protein n=1 Tax=Cylindrobasidium torrendii FP15055 ss-10 TaxID=1314674 RepID=A0A0D7BFK1_9AGAR|nr:hypothetical protein CYLTODRAFT_421622 [Cylindrobasidium torrendii FP15055 ss-10]